MFSKDELKTEEGRIKLKNKLEDLQEKKNNYEKEVNILDHDIERTKTKLKDLGITDDELKDPKKLLESASDETQKLLDNLNDSMETAKREMLDVGEA